jgi:hypothetical protein
VAVAVVTAAAVDKLVLLVAVPVGCMVAVVAAAEIITKIPHARGRQIIRSTVVTAVMEQSASSGPVVHAPSHQQIRGTYKWQLFQASSLR